MLQRRLIQQGRAYLLWGVAGFVAVQLLLGLLIDQAWPGVRDRVYADQLRQIRHLQAEEPDAPLVVALGSSRTMMGLQATRLHLTADGQPALVYNCARPGCGPMFQLLTMQRLLADGVRPRKVLVEIMPCFFNQQEGTMLDERCLDPATLQGHEVVRVRRFANNPWRLVKHWGLGRVLPCYRFGVEMEQQLPIETASAAVDRNRGWQTLHAETTPEARKSMTDVALGQYRDGLTDFHLANKPVRAVHDLLALCWRNGVEVAVVVPPEGTTFRALYVPATFPVMAAFLAHLQRECGAPVIDAREWIADEEFWDSHHLRPSGAVQFTDRLGSELEAAWLTRNTN
jgi:Protein of unknown function (DUF1574)